MDDQDVLPSDRALVSLDDSFALQLSRMDAGDLRRVDASRGGAAGRPHRPRSKWTAAKLTGGLPYGSRAFAMPTDGVLEVPFSLAFPDQGSILIESDGADDGAATRRAAMPSRCVCWPSHPPGRVSFMFIDPVGLGQNFAGLMHLADYEESLINSRIWTQTAQIEQRLAELNEHMEKVIQMYLRNEYATIAEYNAQAGTIAEKYHFLVIADFPSNFSEIAASACCPSPPAAPAAACTCSSTGTGASPLPDPRSPTSSAAPACASARRRVPSGSRASRTRLSRPRPAAGAAGLDHAAAPHRQGQQRRQPRRGAVRADRPGDRRDLEVETTEELRVPIGRPARRSCRSSPSATAPASTR